MAAPVVVEEQPEHSSSSSRADDSTLHAQNSTTCHDSYPSEAHATRSSVSPAFHPIPLPEQEAVTVQPMVPASSIQPVSPASSIASICIPSVPDSPAMSMDTGIRSAHSTEAEQHTIESGRPDSLSGDGSADGEDPQDYIEEEDLYRSLAENELACVPFGISLERYLAGIIYRCAFSWGSQPYACSYVLMIVCLHAFVSPLRDWQVWVPQHSTAQYMALILSGILTTQRTTVAEHKQPQTTTCRWSDSSLL